MGFKLYFRYLNRRIQNSRRLAVLIDTAFISRSKKIQQHLHIDTASESFSGNILSAALIIHNAYIIFAVYSADIRSVHDSAETQLLAISEWQYNAVRFTKIKFKLMRNEIRGHKRLLSVDKHL